MSVRKGIILFLTITVSVALFIIIKTIDKETWYLIAHLHPRVIMMTLLWVLLTWTMDFFTLKVLARSTDGDFTLKEGIDIVLINYFGAAITPLQSGGGPFQVYLLYRAGIPIGKGIAITLMRTILLLIILSIGGPIILHYYPNLLPGVWGKIAYYYVISFVVGVWTVIFFSIYKPRAIKKSAFLACQKVQKKKNHKEKALLQHTQIYKQRIRQLSQQSRVTVQQKEKAVVSRHTIFNDKVILLLHGSSNTNIRTRLARKPYKDTIPTGGILLHTLLRAISWW